MYAFGKLMQTKRQVRMRVSVGLRDMQNKHNWHAKTKRLKTNLYLSWRQISIFRLAAYCFRIPCVSFNFLKIYRRGFGAGSARSPRALSHFFSPKISISPNPRREHANPAPRTVCAPFPCGAHLKFTQWRSPAPDCCCNRWAGWGPEREL